MGRPGWPDVERVELDEIARAGDPMVDWEAHCVWPTPDPPPHAAAWARWSAQLAVPPQAREDPSHHRA
jgi:hypothetical protein